MGTIIKKSRIQVSNDSRTIGPGSEPGGDRQDSKIEIRRNGEVIEAIEVTCSCGRRTTLECDYDASGPAGQ